MPQRKLRPTLAEVKALLAEDQDFLRPLVQAALQELLEAEMTEALGAEKGERTPDRLGYRAGYYGRTLVTRVGKLELRVPQDRAGRFSTELFERYQRSEKTLVAALAEMDVQGVSTRKVKAITEELCGHSFSAAAISAINIRLDEELAQFAGRRLDEACPYLIVDARYERIPEAGVIGNQAVLLAIGIGWDGRRSLLAVELANRESRSSWREFLLRLRERGLSGVEFVVSDDHAGLRQAIIEVLPEAAWQRCYVHFLRNALDDVPRKVDDDCLRELRWLYDRRDLAEARRDLAAWLAKWQATYPKLCGWVEEHIEETLTFYRLPRQHHKRLKSTNLLERLNEEIKRRTHVVRIFPEQPRHRDGARIWLASSRRSANLAVGHRPHQGRETLSVARSPNDRDCTPRAAALSAALGGGRVAGCRWRAVQRAVLAGAVEHHPDQPLPGPVLAPRRAAQPRPRPGREEVCSAL